MQEILKKIFSKRIIFAIGISIILFSSFNYFVIGGFTNKQVQLKEKILTTEQKIDKQFSDRKIKELEEEKAKQNENISELQQIISGQKENIANIQKTITQQNKTIQGQRVLHSQLQTVQTNQEKNLNQQKAEIENQNQELERQKESIKEQEKAIMCQELIKKTPQRGLTAYINIDIVKYYEETNLALTEAEALLERVYPDPDEIEPEHQTVIDPKDNRKYSLRNINAEIDFDKEVLAEAQPMYDEYIEKCEHPK